MENCLLYGVMLPHPPVVVVGGCSFVFVFFFFICNNTALFFGTLEMQRSFVFKDKLVCIIKKKTRMVSMATVNIILEHGVNMQNYQCFHYYLS